MNEILLKHEEIDTIFKAHLKIESKVMSIDSIFSNPRLARKIDYKPYYQRNYVWDNEKATYFIESILIGTEIPPLVFFKNKNIEIIDGRQRYETIKNFIDKKLVLSSKGLHSLKYLAKKNFDDLDEIDEEIKNIFLNTQIRILEFSVVNEPRLTERREDLIKKEIFRRYNSGITPLKNTKIERALYISDDLTEGIKKKLEDNTKLYNMLTALFTSDRDLANGVKKREIVDKLVSKLRHLLVLHYVPIRKYSYGYNRGELFVALYEHLVRNIEDVNLFYKNFNYKIEMLYNLYCMLEKQNLSNNKLVYECTLWMFNILEEERKLDSNVSNLMTEYFEYIVNNYKDFTMESSHFYKNVYTRYTTVGNFIKDRFKINIKIYIDSNNEEILKNENKLDIEDENYKLDSIRLNKPEPTSMTIDDIIRMMNRNKFLIRPPYQRHEVINRIKSSALIESILLGIKLPPVFVFRRADGMHEVIDGQQRLLSILGFLGEEFINEDGRRVKSEKNKYKLKNMRILSEHNKKDFEDLDEELKDKIFDFNLSVVIIDEKINPNFNNIDLFIRLNNKPYPIRDNSFEMWNSYIDKDIISLIKENFEKHQKWFYLKKVDNDKRMANFELYTTLVYLEYKKSNEGIGRIENFLNIYQRNSNINTRIKQKKDITKLLDTVTVNKNNEKEEFIACIDRVETFINKLEKIISLNKAENDLHLNLELNNLMQLKNSRRTAQSFYSIWLILNELSDSYINGDISNLSTGIVSIMKLMKNNNAEKTDRINEYREEIRLFHQRYNKM